MSRETTYVGMVGDWQKLLVTLEANIAEIPQLEPFRVKLGTLVTQALDVTKRQADLKASKQAASKQMRQLASDAQRLASTCDGSSQPEANRRSPGKPSQAAAGHRNVRRPASPYDGLPPLAAVRRTRR
jgi:hypothetical protein